MVLLVNYLFLSLQLDWATVFCVFLLMEVTPFRLTQQKLQTSFIGEKLRKGQLLCKLFELRAFESVLSCPEMIVQESLFEFELGNARFQQ